MDKLSKSQKDEYATAFAILALYDGGVSSKQAKVQLPLPVLFVLDDDVGICIFCSMIGFEWSVLSDDIHV